MIDITKVAGFDGHRLVANFHDPYTGLNSIIAIHRGSAKLPSFGATRITTYKSYSEAMEDTLKLSKLMSYKAAMAGVKYGGAKAVIISNHARKSKELLLSYANCVNYLGGRFITGADVGVSPEDVKLMRQVSKYMVGVTADPVQYTAAGVFAGIQVSLKEALGSDKIAGNTFAIQGIGKIGKALLDLLYKEGGKIIISDVNKSVLRNAKQEFPDVTIVSPNEIYKQKVQVFCPCALGNSISIKTINKLRCQIIAGGANGQLQNDETGDLLYKLSILYAPDYVINAGGLISVVDEFENHGTNHKRVLNRLKVIKENLKKIYSLSNRKKQATNLIAKKLAEDIFNSH
jgi:leucine dehydrogenase